MKVLVVGGGGREHALAAALERSGAELYSAMRNNNPGIARLAKEVRLVRETDVSSILEFARAAGVDIAVMGPEAPLEAGLVDALEAEGIGCVGPTKAAARLETSKSFARELMQRYGVPGNLRFASFDDLDEAKGYVREAGFELAIKPVGLTGGKGVKVQGEHLHDIKESEAYLEEIFGQGLGGGSVILEERAVGEEFTLQVFCDGRNVVPMPLVQDHKRAYEGDVGPNTGGMGSYSAEDHLLPFVSESDKEAALDILRRTVEAIAQEGHPYRGVLYGQFMLTRDGPRVIEFNARFGDPEAMNVLSILETPFLEVCEGIVDGSLSPNVSFARKATVCKYVVPAGYGTAPQSGKPIEVDEEAVAREGARLYYAMVDGEAGRVVTTTSRALGVVGIDDSIQEAEEACERALRHVRGEAIFVRHDIGKAELVNRRVEHMARLRKA
ncbi:MAG TPA: phosphoribosylamine--glycine ligase [Methanomassiliicoccaceae archaeon]|jgi:phosphoribosylamine--glycine ligase|nr:phosphoribosylamine--glycine ligase [Euryarchaeota archaeon]HOB38912.1 phosphoribosylamine--glycine ligase [Methanomassiliicoccaceae archaeon]HOK27415.1 phosphoribosylamine--glycine ligase [Methanomassiliicoccaceae archaeon]HQA21775.1 phosphoribosylamine--glycine ligase [Methanomassiliicoccaceae archaeon]HQD88439.1 phosphoribosylamine--glycine ligase [Methanomassiliicoccaceae archaeon]